MYIKLVYCVGRVRLGKFLAQAPAFSEIHKEDEVMVRFNDQKELRCRVINAVDFITSSAEFQFVLDMETSDVATLPKVMSKVSYHSMMYGDNTENADMVE